MAPFYPTLVSEKFVPTVNFYEDFFDFVPVIEREGYVLLRRENNPDACIAFFDKTHACVQDAVPLAQGIVVNIVENDVKGKYDSLYMEGLDFYKGFGRDINDRDHFIVFDPNGIMVNVHAPLS